MAQTSTSEQHLFLHRALAWLNASRPALPGALSCGLAVTIALASLGTNFTFKSLVFAGYASAGCVIAGGGVLLDGIVGVTRQGRASIRPMRIVAWMSALVSLLSGCLLYAARVVGSPGAHTVFLHSVLYTIPIVAIVSFVSGIVQLPRRARVPVFLMSVGALGTGYVSQGADTLRTRLSVVVVALVTAAASVWAWRLVRVLSRACRTLVRISCASLTAVMAYAVIVALTPTAWWPHYAPPVVLALSYVVAATFGFLAALFYCGPVRNDSDSVLIGGRGRRFPTAQLTRAPATRRVRRRPSAPRWRRR